MAALADHLRAERVFVAGWSGGGAAALATAALLPECVRSCVAIAGFSPYAEVGDEWFTGMTDEDRNDSIAAYEATPDEAERMFTEWSQMFVQIAPEAFGSFPNAPDVDKEAFKQLPSMGIELAAQIRLGVANGPFGWMDDHLSFMHPWGFDVRDISVAVTIRHGEADRNVPVFHGRWLVDNIPNAIAQILPGEGHASIAVSMVPIIDSLIETDTGAVKETTP